MTDHVAHGAYDAARRSAGLIDRSDRGRIVVSGRDRATYLQGLLSNDIVALKPGDGCYAAYLTAQGRMIADLLVYELGDVMLVTVAGDVTEAVLAKFDQFIFSEDVTLGNVTEAFGQYAVVGPEAASVVARTLEGAPVDVLSALREHGNVRATFRGHPAIVTRVTDTGEPGLDLFVGRDVAADLTSALQSAGAMALAPEVADAIRVEAGVPVFHRDMDEDTIPLEAGIESRAISLTKGCYVGQEVIIRVLHRGHGRVARKLVGLLLEGPVAPSRGAVVHSGDREIGRVTSATVSPALHRPIALAYLQRDFLEPGTPVVVDGTPGKVVALPFVVRA
jgi:folate-binding protein YgfZ